LNQGCCGCEVLTQGSNASVRQRWCDDIPAAQRAAVPACTSTGLEDPRVLSGNLPAWCSSIPVAARINVLPCTDVGRCSCSDACSVTPSISWRYSPICCSCDGRPEPPIVLVSLPSSAPTWCSEVPVALRDYAPACNVTGGCSCEETCSSVPAQLQRFNPMCCGCAGSAAPERVSGSDASPGWCASVPEAQRVNVLPCAGMGQCQCSSFCSASPRMSWHYNPMCCGCTGAHAPAVPAPPDAGSSAPTWCSRIPETQRHHVTACTSRGACRCADSCMAAPAFTWRFNPLCCECAALSEATPAPGGNASSVPGLGCSCSSFCSLAPAAWWHHNPLCCGCASSTPAPTDAPTAAPSPAPAGGSGGTPAPGLGCSCSGLCGWAPSGSWRYNPLCCSCAGSGGQ